MRGGGLLGGGKRLDCLVAAWTLGVFLGTRRAQHVGARFLSQRQVLMMPQPWRVGRRRGKKKGEAGTNELAVDGDGEVAGEADVGRPLGVALGGGGAAAHERHGRRDAGQREPAGREREERGRGVRLLARRRERGGRERGRQRRHAHDDGALRAGAGGRECAALRALRLHLREEPAARLALALAAARRAAGRAPAAPRPKELGPAVVVAVARVKHPLLCSCSSSFALAKEKQQGKKRKTLPNATKSQKEEGGKKSLKGGGGGKKKNSPRLFGD